MKKLNPFHEEKVKQQVEHEAKAHAKRVQLRKQKKSDKERRAASLKEYNDFLVNQKQSYAEAEAKWTAEIKAQEIQSASEEEDEDAQQQEDGEGDDE